MDEASGKHAGEVKRFGDMAWFSRRWVYVLLAVLILYSLVRGFVGAATKTMWYDELATEALTAQPNLKVIWEALERPFDGSPIGFYVVERLGFGLFKNKEIATRFPAILAMPITIGCVFVYAKKRNGSLVALLCAALILPSILFTRYGIEGRPYALLVACIAFALVCYQRVPAASWTILLAISLALAQTIHYFAVFAMVPFGLAEAVFFLRTKQFRWKVWLSLACGPVPLIFFWPLLARYRSYYGGHFYASYGLTSIPVTFGNFFLTDNAYGAALAGVCIVGLLGARFWRGAETQAGAAGNGDFVEGTLLLGLLCLPIIAYIAVTVMHGGVRDAYILPAILGVFLAVGCILSSSHRIGAALFIVFLAANVGVREFRFWKSAHALHLEKPSDGLETFLRNTGYADSKLPIVVASGMVYVPLVYYSPEPLAKRLFYLSDEKELLDPSGDMFNRNVKFFKDYMPLQLADWGRFIGEHPVFLLYGEEPESYGEMWVTKHIFHEGYFVQGVGVDPIRRLFLVNTKIGSQENAQAPRSGLPFHRYRADSRTLTDEFTNFREGRIPDTAN